MKNLLWGLEKDFFTVVSKNFSSLTIIILGYKYDKNIILSVLVDIALDG